MKLSPAQTRVYEMIKAVPFVHSYGGVIPKHTGVTYKILNALSARGLINSEYVHFEILGKKFINKVWTATN